MSIINKVLNDIEEQSKIEKKTALGSLEPVYIKELDNSKYLYLVIGTLLAVILGLLWWLFSSPKVLQVNSEDKPQTSIIAKSTDIEAIALNEETHNKKIVAVKHINESSSKEIISKKAVSEQVILEQVVPKKVALTKRVSNVVSPSKVISSPIYPDDIVVEDSKPNTVNSILDNKNVDNKNDINVKNSLSITPVKMSNIAVANLKLKQGIKAQKNGDITKAQKMWQEALTIKPDLHDARIQLAASFYGANELSKALSLISKAIRQFPQYDGYRLMAAQIYYQEKQPEKALSVLNSPFNKIDVATENLALAGSLAQQLQQWSAAQSNYKVLVNRDNNNSQWVLGLAIAYDALGEKENAHRYYSRLLSLGNVDQAIREYARKRSSILKTSMNTRGHNG